MSEIPDEIVKKVAREMADRWSSFTNLRQPYDTLSAVTQRAWQECARSALSASGWAEMREALETIIQIMDSPQLPHHNYAAAKYAALEVLRLSKAKGEGV